MLLVQALYLETIVLEKAVKIDWIRKKDKRLKETASSARVTEQ